MCRLTKALKLLMVVLVRQTETPNANEWWMRIKFAGQQCARLPFPCDHSNHNVNDEAIKVRFIQIFHLVRLSPIDYSEHKHSHIIAFTHIIINAASIYIEECRYKTFHFLTKSISIAT